jgi:autotransporter adhesin
MNHVYRIVRNAIAGGSAATSELAKGHSKGSRKASHVSANSVLRAGSVMLATALGSFAIAPSAMAGSIINCGAGNSSYSSFTAPSAGPTGAWNNGNNPGTCATAGTTGVVLSEDGNYYSPNGTSAAVLVGASVGNATGTVGIYGPKGITMTGNTTTTGTATFNSTTTTAGLATFQSGATMNNAKITSLAAGTVSAASTDAVNGSQLYATNMNVSNLQTSVNNINNGTAGLVQQNATTKAITVASATAGTTVDFTGTAGTRQLKGVSQGTSDTDAVNVSQLKGVTTALGGGATVDPTTGAVIAPTYTVTNADGTTSTFNTVGDAVSNLDGRVAGNTKDIATLNTNVSNITNQLNNGEVGLVQQDATTGNITVAKGLNGNVVDFTNAQGSARVLTSVAAGTVSASSADAINGSQLFNASASTASAMGGGSTVNPDGTITAPSYVVNGQTLHNAGDAITNLDTEVTNVAGRMDSITNEINNGTLGLVQQDSATGNITVASATNGQLVNFTGSQGARVLTGVANGAVNSTSLDAVNGSQLFAVQANLQQQISGITTQMTTIDSRVTQTTVDNANNGSATGDNSTATGANSTASGSESTATGWNANASGNNSTADGAGSIASGDNSTAVGHHAKATGNNAVAIGADSVADRDNTVSMGSAGHERQITNVAAGTEDTDAVNLGQMNSALHAAVGDLPAGMSAKAYTDQQVNAVQDSVNQVAKNAYAGVAAAMAMPNMTPSGPGKTIVAGGAGAYKNGSALAVGVTHRSMNSKWLVNAAVSATSTGDAGVRTQVGYEF